MLPGDKIIFGIRFGFRYVLIGRPEGASVKLKMVGRYPAPGLVDPATRKARRFDEYFIDAPIAKSYTSYSLDKDWELVPGPWTFEIWYNNRKMAEKTFTLFKP